MSVRSEFFFFTAVKSRVEFFWVDTPCNVVASIFSVKKEAARSSETLASYLSTTRHKLVDLDLNS
jgi:hypothetical protein